MVGALAISSFDLWHVYNINLNYILVDYAQA